jgi:hypothetical protein
MPPWRLCAWAPRSTAPCRLVRSGYAVRDLQILRLIEERESTDALSAETLSEAMLTRLNARMICGEGRAIDALVIYDDVPGSLTPHGAPKDNGRSDNEPGAATAAPRLPRWHQGSADKVCFPHTGKPSSKCVRYKFPRFYSLKKDNDHVDKDYE